VNGVLIIVWLCAAIAVAVFAAMIVSIITFHKPLRDGPPTSVAGKGTEILWALIPIAIVFASAIPAMTTIGGGYNVESAKTDSAQALNRK
jgi:heme/copper-type cytochrome/quinol oxidase subunit 2